MPTYVKTSAGKDASGRNRYSGLTRVGRTKGSGGGYVLQEGGEISNEPGALARARVQQEKADAQKAAQNQPTVQTAQETAAATNAVRTDANALQNAIRAQTAGQTIQFDQAKLLRDAVNAQARSTGTTTPVTPEQKLPFIQTKQERVLGAPTVFATGKESSESKTSAIIQKSKLETYKAQRILDNPEKPIIAAAPAFGAAVLTRIPASTKQSVEAVTIKAPETVYGLGTTAYDIAARTFKGDVLAAPKILVTEPFTQDPSGFVASAITDTAVGIGAEKAGLALQKGYVKAGSTYIPPEKVFGEPTSPSTKASLEAFKQNTKDGRTTIVTVSPSKLSGETIGYGRKGGTPVPLEDPGAYFAPEGRANPMFTRIEGTVPNTKSGFSIRPYPKIDFSIPTVSRTTVSEVSLQPREVVNVPGFEATKKFLESQAGSDKAFITKRSEIGQGTVRADKFVASQSFESPIPFTVERQGTILRSQTEIKKGDILQAKGTSEIEAVVPPGTQFKKAQFENRIAKIKGFEFYTEYKGRAIALRDIELVTKNGLKPFTETNPDIVTTKQLAKESESVSSAISKPLYEFDISAPILLRSSTLSSKASQTSSALGSRSSQSVPSFQSETSTIKPQQSFVSQPKVSSNNNFQSSTQIIQPISSTQAIPSNSFTQPKYNFGSSKTKTSSNIPLPIEEETPIKKTTKNKKTVLPGFGVLVKRKGRFVDVGEGFTREAALARGARSVLDTAAATFKIVQRGEATKGFGFSTPSSDLLKFRQKDKNTFIQLSKTRIGSAGEKKEITFAPRKKM